MLFFQLDRQHIPDAESAGHCFDQKRCRSGDHQDAVTCFAVLSDLAHGIAVDQRLDHIFNEGLDNMSHFFSRTAHQRGQAEGHVVFHRQRAEGVFGHQLGVLAQKGFPVHPADLGHLVRP